MHHSHDYKICSKLFL